MNAQPPRSAPTTWPYVALVVLLSAIGNNWSPSGVRTLGYTLVALVAVGYAVRDR
ncbi:hypothetical protein [Actinacidiphila rubida]|uniref:Uncharacterized protein n=1 Tax=Actinacidiphila rubida TaxID=310780 RepID=A0A1H8L8C5_9ACTN|nr:hypothetical protein [Actinacidiphila rubida]SEO01367.1 hypothetical protein SAMN05216267_101593 [Actinacidiphila rubida]